MTTPLILISFFAIAAGWVGIPATFPVLGGIVPNWIENFLEPYMEYMHLHAHHASFHVVPLAVSLLVALGGLGAGYLVYGQGLKEGQTDPVARLLGPIWWMWHRKYWIDELYHVTIVLFTMWLSRFLALFDREWIIDWIVNGVGRLTIRFSDLTSAFDRFVVDGFVDGVGWVSDQAGHIARMLQDGRVQTYLLFGMLILAVWLFLNVLPMILTLV